MIKHVMRLITARFTNKGPRLKGSCNQCGECCRYLTLSNGDALLRGREDFDRLCSRKPEYRIFDLQYVDELEQVAYFRCSQLGDDNRCRDYENRPKVCRIYPNPRMFQFGARLPQACGYQLTPESGFDAVLKRSMKKPLP